MSKPDKIVALLADAIFATVGLLAIAGGVFGVAMAETIGQETNGLLCIVIGLLCWGLAK